MTRVLGIVGGTGPESTVDYYRSIIADWQSRTADGSYPRLIINSVEAGRIFRLLGERDFSAVAADVADAVGQLAASAIWPHHRAADLQRTGCRVACGARP